VLVASPVRARRSTPDETVVGLPVSHG